MSNMGRLDCLAGQEFEAWWHNTLNFIPESIFRNAFLLGYAARKREEATKPSIAQQKAVESKETAEKRLMMYEARFNYICDNSLIYGTGNGQQVHFSVPVCHEDLGCAIDEAIKNNLTSPPAIKPWPIKP
jgi:hypothetical protein